MAICPGHRRRKRINYDEILRGSSLLLDQFEHVSPDRLRELTQGDDRAWAVFLEEPMGGGRYLRSAHVSQDVYLPFALISGAQPTRIIAHDGIGHSIQSWVWPERWLDEDHLAAYARSVGVEPSALEAELRAASREVRPDLVQHVDQDRLYEYFPDAVAYYTYEPNYFRDEFPGVARMIRDVWNPHPKAASTIQFRTILPWLLATGGGAGLLEAVLRERAPGSAEAATLP